MKNLKIGDRVIFIEDCLIQKGTIQNIYATTPNTAIIRLADGNITKAYINNVALDILTEIKPPIAKDETKHIKKVDFVKALYKVASPEGMLGDRFDEVNPESFLDKSIILLLVGLDLVEVLFANGITIETTERDILSAIEDCTTPEALEKRIRPDKFPAIQKLCKLVFDRLVKELFEATND